MKLNPITSIFLLGTTHEILSRKPDMADLEDEALSLISIGCMLITSELLNLGSRGREAVEAVRRAVPAGQLIVVDLFDRRLYVGIVGTRRRDSTRDGTLVMDALRSLLLPLGFDGIDRLTIVSGGCLTGADRFAEMIAAIMDAPTIIHRPDRTLYPDTPEPWRSTKQNYARNTLVARDSAYALIACVAPDRTGGTEDTIAKWRRYPGRGEPILV